MKKSYLKIAPLILFLSGCVTPSAEFLNRDYKPKKKGVVRYSLRPMLFQSNAVQQRRMDAEVKMENFCHPEKPLIVSEKKQEKEVGFRTSSSYHSSGQTGANYHDQTYGDRYRYGTAGAAAAHSQSGGGSSTYSEPVIKYYNVIEFECQ